MTALRAIVGGKTAATRAERPAGGQLDHLHATPPATIAVLLAHERFGGAVHEPACGDGAIARALIGAGYQVVASDIADHGYGRPGIDFRALRRPAAPNLVTNPPFDNLGGEIFARHGIKLLSAVAARPGRTRKMALLHRVRFLETVPRDDIFDHPAFVRVLVLRERQPMMHRPGYTGPALKPSPEFYAWYVWDFDHPRPPGADPQLRRV